MKPKENKTKLHNPRGILIPLGIAALIFKSYLFYYNSIVEKIEDAIFSAKSEQWDFGEHKFSGFPYRISLNVTNPSSNPSSNGFSAQEIRITASPFELQNLVIDEIAGLRFTNQSGKYDLIASKLKSSFKFDVKAKELSHFAIEFDALEVKNNSDTIVQLGPTKSQFVREFGNTPKQAINIEIANLETNNSILGVELDFDEIILRGPLINENGNQTLDIKYGKAQINGSKISDITGKLALLENAEIDGAIEFCFEPSGEFALKTAKMCNLKLDIKNSKLSPNFSALLRGQ